MDESSESSTRAESDGCRQCERLEQLFKSLVGDLRARDQLILSRIASLDDQLSAVLSRISVSDPSISGKKNKKMPKKSKASMEEQDSADPGDLPRSRSRSRSRARRPSSGSRTDREANGTGLARGCANSCSASASLRADSDECTNSGRATRSTGSTASRPASSTVPTPSVDPPVPEPFRADKSDLQPREESHGLPHISDDLPWQLVSHTKPQRYKKTALYVGNLREDVLAENIANWVMQRSHHADLDVTVTSCSLVDKSPNSKLRGAHLIISGKDSQSLMKRSFWPKPVYARRWKFRDSMSPHNGAENTAKSVNDASQSSDPILSTAVDSADACAGVGAIDNLISNARNTSSGADVPDDQRAASISDPITLALSPDSNWGDQYDKGGHDEEHRDHDADELREGSGMPATPGGVALISRGKSRQHESSLSPEGNDAKLVRTADSDENSDGKV